MDDEIGGEKEEDGMPGWVMTFADLMSLLLAFFVLLFSFSEMDKAVFKQVGGSMKEAFGVQQDIQIRDPLRGLHFIATEFSPGRPDPTKINEIRQTTTQTYMRYLLIRDATESRNEEEEKLLIRAVVREVQSIAEENDKKGGEKSKKREAELTKLAQEILAALAQELQFQGGGLQDVMESGTEGGMGSSTADVSSGEQQSDSAVRGEGEMQARAEEAQDGDGNQVAKIEGSPLAGAEYVIRSMDEQISKMEEEEGEELEQARKILEAFKKQVEGEREDAEEFKAQTNWIEKELMDEIKNDMIQIQTDNESQRLVIRIREKASFPAGSAELQKDAMPAMQKIAKLIRVMNGEIVVAGHTDSRPINTYRFRSNWELSTARAVSVTHELIRQSGLPQTRFQVRGFGATKPVSTNETDKGRFENRRVEVIIVRGESRRETISVTQDLADKLKDYKDQPKTKKRIKPQALADDVEPSMAGIKRNDTQVKIGRGDSPEKPKALEVEASVNEPTKELERALDSLESQAEELISQSEQQEEQAIDSGFQPIQMFKPF